MPITITIITIANRRRTFCKPEETDIDDLRSSVEKYKKLFSQKTLVIGSSTETEIFASASITRIEIDGVAGLSQMLPGAGETIIQAIESSDSAPIAATNHNKFAGRVDFFFEGGDTLSTLIDSPRPMTQAEKVAEFTQLFDQGAVPYTTIRGGLGFMNSSVMTRTLIHAASQQLPITTWKAEPC